MGKWLPGIEINVHEKELCFRLAIYEDYTEMHGQQNIKNGWFILYNFITQCMAQYMIYYTMCGTMYNCITLCVAQCIILLHNVWHNV